MKRLVAAILSCALLGPMAHAQQPLDVDALKTRSDARDRTATRALAEAYYAGSGGVTQDFALAAQYFQRLSELGDVRAMTTLGLMYARGIGVPKNMAEAMNKWRFAASQRTPDSGAEYNLGVAYLRGDGIPADEAQALHWLRRAASRGHVLAQADLGVMYMEGTGTAKDEVQGAAWLIVAAERGDAAAQERLKLFSDRLSPAQVDEAHKRANQWLKQPDARR